jgi:hypothetical protein
MFLAALLLAFVRFFCGVRIALAPKVTFFALSGARAGSSDVEVSVMNDVINMIDDEGHFWLFRLFPFFRFLKGM